MAGFITIEDGRSYARSNWAYDSVVDAIAEKLPNTELGSDFKNWLLAQRCYDRSTGEAIRGSGLGSVDLREISPPCRKLFWDAAYVAYAAQDRDGGVAWEDAEMFEEWLTSFAALLFLRETYREGEPPHEFNPHMRGLIPPTGRKVGPGW